MTHYLAFKLWPFVRRTGAEKRLELPSQAWRVQPGLGPTGQHVQRSQCLKAIDMRICFINYKA